MGGVTAPPAGGTLGLVGVAFTPGTWQPVPPAAHAATRCAMVGE
jgi:hypothetical protein